ncbi:MAG: diaminopimelate decarboxylase, partial [Nitrososphaerota archaeon]
MFPKGILENKNGELYIENVSTIELAKKFDTPLYVISETRIRENYRRIYNALIENYEKIRIYYSAKANTNISILKILENEGAYVDTVSPGEVFLAFKAGFNPEKILFTGTSVRNDELEFLLSKNITINIDSISQ